LVDVSRSLVEVKPMTRKLLFAASPLSIEQGGHHHNLIKCSLFSP
jgi:hypothetical protein